MGGILEVMGHPKMGGSFGTMLKSVVIDLLSSKLKLNKKLEQLEMDHLSLGRIDATQKS